MTANVDMSTHTDVTLAYAKDELRSYIIQLTGESKHQISLIIDEAAFEQGVVQTEWDDSYSIKVTSGIGSIAGSNVRSVLLGVYRYLTELGCRFYRPTKQGEFIPAKKLEDCTVHVAAKAAHRHRGICIEGAPSLENVLDLIEWAPKVGFNAYFLQFRDSFTFFERWYTHEGNDTLPKGTFTREQCALFMDEIIESIKKRGMIYHAIGHGWTCESIGFPSTGWHKVPDEQIPDNKRHLLAEINGKRTFFEGIPLNTQLCYSNPQASRMIVEEIIDYVQKHKEIDILHVWLGDNFNNFCECETCRITSPTDHYVRIINEVDRRLTKLGLDNKIAFLIYLELLWTPQTEQIDNPDRFIMMYAPIHRTYTSSFLKDGVAPERGRTKPMPFELNKVKYPADIDNNLAFLYAWQEVFTGDSFDFDYHLMWDIHREYSGLRLARVIYDDIIGLEKLGLNGYVSCQMQRAFFPNGLGMYILGRTLFDKSQSFEELVSEYFQAAYGSHADMAHPFLQELGRLMPHEYTRNETPMLDANANESFKKAVAWLGVHLPVIENAIREADDAGRAVMLRILYLSASLSLEIAKLLERKSSGTPKEQLAEEWKPIKRFINEHELELQEVLDVYYFNMITEGIIVNDW